MTVFTRYSENESKIEALLPLIADFDISLLYTPKRFSVAEREVEPDTNDGENRRTQVFKGERVVSRVTVKPSHLDDLEQLINFGTTALA
jgi:hypothetical protein